MTGDEVMQKDAFSLRLKEWPPERWLAAGLAIAGVVLLGLILANKLFLYGGDIGGQPYDYSNRLYLFSAIAQALAAILALLVSLTLVATQLAAQSYSPRVVRLRLHDPWLWWAAGLYLAAILWAMVFHGWLDLLGAKSADIALLLAGAALLYLIPFTIATLHSLDPIMMATNLARSGLHTALEDMIRKAAQDDQISTIRDAMDAFTQMAWSMVQRRHTDKAMELGEKILSAGMFLTQRRSLEGYECAMDKLTQLARASRQSQRLLEASIFEGQRKRLEDEWKGMT